MERYKVSVIVPIYNVERYLDKCIKSLLNQTLKEIEIILIDDGSPDRCPELCDAYAHNYDNIKVIHKTNEGLGMARNTGVEVACGEYITFCDSDDWIDPDAYGFTYNYCILNNLDICCFQSRLVYPDGRVEKNSSTTKEMRFFGKSQVKEFLLDVIGKDYSNPGSTTYSMSSCMALFRRECFIKSGIRYPSERVVASEDLVFLLYFLPYVERVAVIPNVFYNYLMNPTSISHSFSDAKYLRLINLHSEVRDYCETRFEWLEYKNHYFTQMFRIFKVILYYISIDKSSLQNRRTRINNEIGRTFFSPFFNDPVRHKYGLVDRILIYCMKHKLSLVIILLFKIKHARYS